MCGEFKLIYKNQIIKNNTLEYILQIIYSKFRTADKFIWPLSQAEIFRRITSHIEKKVVYVDQFVLLNS